MAGDSWQTPESRTTQWGMLADPINPGLEEDPGGNITPVKQHHDGMRVTLSALKNGLTKTPSGRKLLDVPFIFQCGPLEQFDVVHAFNFGLYDTIARGQFSRWGSMQLATWSFDTAVLYMTGGRLPPWVPFRADRPSNQGKHSPQWYREQLRDLHNAGAPFKFSAYMPGDEGPAHRGKATLTGFSESYKAGETDAIYLEGVSFAAWRDPTASKKKGASLKQSGGKLKAAPQVADQPPTTITLTSGGQARLATGQVIPAKGGQSGGAGVVPYPTTLSDLARFFYHDPADWKRIVTANGLTGVSGSTPLKDIKGLPNKVKIPEGASGGAGLG